MALESNNKSTHQSRKSVAFVLNEQNEQIFGFIEIVTGLEPPYVIFHVLTTFFRLCLVVATYNLTYGFGTLRRLPPFFLIL